MSLDKDVNLCWEDWYIAINKQIDKTVKDKLDYENMWNSYTIDFQKYKVQTIIKNDKLTYHRIKDGEKEYYPFGDYKK